VWPILHYDDTELALRFLRDVLGFGESLIIRDDGGDVVHAEMSWPGGGALNFGGTQHLDGIHGSVGAGTSALYVVTDDLEAVHERVLGSGMGSVVQPPTATCFGAGAVESHAFTARDPEGNLWTFGTYRGAA
jgi:uncharacterized glyoxalase superfamily protein PhnB